MQDNLQYIFQSDWFLCNISSHLSPIEFYKIRYISKLTYKNITLNDIYARIIKIICLRLEYELKEQ